VAPALAAAVEASVAAAAPAERAKRAAEPAIGAGAKRRNARAKAEPSRPSRQPRLRVVPPGGRRASTAESPANGKAVKAAKRRKARPLAAAR